MIFLLLLLNFISGLSLFCISDIIWIGIEDVGINLICSLVSEWYVWFF